MMNIMNMNFWKKTPDGTYQRDLVNSIYSALQEKQHDSRAQVKGAITDWF